MNIKTEIIKSYISDVVCNSILDFDIDADEIVCVFYKNNIDAGGCHDF